MKIGGPFSALGNPMIIGLLGLSAAKDVADLHQAYQQQHANDFLAQAYETGQPVTSMPGGPFRRIASTLTGGAISPNIQASGQDLMVESMLLDKIRRGKLQEEESALKLREGLGGQSFAKLTGNPYNFPSVTQKEGAEQKKQQLAQERFEYEKQKNDPAAKIEQKVKEEQALQPYKLDTKRKEEAISLGYAGAKGAATAAAEEPIKVRTAAEETVARARATVAATGEMTLPQFRRTKNITYYDEGTRKPVLDPNISVDTASKNENLIPLKAGKEEDTFNDTTNLINSLKQYRKILPYVFPDVPPGTDLATNAKLGLAGVKNTAAINSDKYVAQAYNMKAAQIRYTKAIQGRYPSAPELALDLLPNPGGLPAYDPSSRGFLPNFNIKHIRADSLKVAQSKVDAMIDEVSHYSKGVITDGSTAPGDEPSGFGSMRDEGK